MKRTFILGSYGFVILGPMFGVWYNRILPKLAPMDFSLPKKQLMFQLARKVLYDETLLSWTYYSSFLFYATYVDTFSVDKAVDKLKTDFIRLYLSDLMPCNRSSHNRRSNDAQSGRPTRAL